MKTLIFLLLIGSAAEAKEFRFTYILDRDKLQYKTDATDWEEAFNRGAQFCYDFFVKREKNLTEERGVEIIDSCANPK